MKRRLQPALVHSNGLIPAENRIEVSTRAWSGHIGRLPTFVKSQMLIQMTGLRVTFAADVAQIRPSADRFSCHFAGLSFLDVEFVRMLNQFDGGHDRLAAFLAHILIASGLLIVQREEMACSVSAKFKCSELISKRPNCLPSKSNHLCSNNFSSVSNLPRHSWHTKYVFRLIRFSRSYTRDGHSD